VRIRLIRFIHNRSVRIRLIRKYPRSRTGLFPRVSMFVEIDLQHNIDRFADGEEQDRQHDRGNYRYQRPRFDRRKKRRRGRKVCDKYIFEVVHNWNADALVRNEAGGRTKLKYSKRFSNADAFASGRGRPRSVRSPPILSSVRSSFEMPATSHRPGRRGLHLENCRPLRGIPRSTARGRE